ncbi:MAG: Fic family protein [Actinomycetes bacterium]|jgi:Fic family protein|nr:Fic family protein [Actinomycetes bacterium]
MRKYIYQYDSWPRLTWNDRALAVTLGEVRLKQGRIVGQLAAMGFHLRQQTAADVLSDDIVHSAAIEGERLDSNQVRSSVARRLGVETAGITRGQDSRLQQSSPSREVNGMVDIMLDATRDYCAPVTAERLFAWHGAMFPTGRSGLHAIKVAGWRDSEMQIVSGSHGHEHVHYEAPPAKQVPNEMRQFLRWVNEADDLDLVIKSGVAHFWFVVIHPFDDGNGRLARALSELLLARSDGSLDRYYSLSTQIMREQAEYYEILKQEQYSSGDITAWLRWYLDCLKHALTDSAARLNDVAWRARFWDQNEDADLNARQRKVINLLLSSFDGRLTTAKWAKLTKVSHDTALRDIKDLMKKNILEQEEAGGRSVSYRLITNQK